MLLKPGVSFIQFIDRSRTSCLVNAAVVIPSFNVTQKFTLPRILLIFTADVTAIIQALKYVLQKQTLQHIIVFFLLQLSYSVEIFTFFSYYTQN